MDFWRKARSFADEASKRTHDLAAGASRISDQLRSEAAKRTHDLTTGASRLSDELRSQAARQAGELTRLASAIGGSSSYSEAPAPELETGTSEKDLEAFGVTEELTEFVQGITPTTFRDFPLEDDTQLYDVDTLKNVSQDLSVWQERHAALVLSTVKEISKLRYELCPRVMKERKFWRIYFILVNSHVAPYEKRYTNEDNSKAAEIVHDTAGKAKNVMEEDVKVEIVMEPKKVDLSSETEVKKPNQQSNTSTSLSTEQDLDVFLLGDLGDNDDGPDDDGVDFDDDFDKILDGLDDDEKDDL